ACAWRRSGLVALFLRLVLAQRMQESASLVASARELLRAFRGAACAGVRHLVELADRLGDERRIERRRSVLDALGFLALAGLAARSRDRVVLVVLLPDDDAGNAARKSSQAAGEDERRGDHHAPHAGDEDPSVVARM